VTETQVSKCRIKWFAVCRDWQTGKDELIPRTRGFIHNRWEAKCLTHEWETRSGGAIEASIKRDIEDHKWDVEYEEGVRDGRF
jgi:hypothetical protein